jgi:hypothetical protein
MLALLRAETVQVFFEIRVTIAIPDDIAVSGIIWV